MDVKNELKDIICSLSPDNLKRDDINDKSILNIDLGFKSLRMVLLIIEIEKRFNINLGDDIFSLSKKFKFRNLVSIVSRLYN